MIRSRWFLVACVCVGLALPFTGVSVNIVLVVGAWLSGGLALIAASRKPAARCPSGTAWRNANLLMGCGFCVLAAALQWGRGLSLGQQWLLALAGSIPCFWGLLWLRRATVRTA